MQHEWGEEECILILERKLEGRRLLERSRRRWVDNLELYVRERKDGLA
jgi:hypothetical protein